MELPILTFPQEVTEVYNSDYFPQRPLELTALQVQQLAFIIVNKPDDEHKKLQLQKILPLLKSIKNYEK